MKIIAKTTFALLLLLFTFSACNKDSGLLTDPIITIEAQTLMDVPYGNNAAQKMDVYLPANRSQNTSLIIFVHGGSFVGGDKSYFTYLVKELVRANFAVLNVNYRLVNATGLYTTPVRHLQSSIKIKDQVADIATIVNYAIDHAKEWQVSESKIGMAGHSAGATLSLLYAYDLINTNKVKAVVNLAGALDQTFVDIPYYYYYLSESALEAGYRYTGYNAGATTDVYYRAISPIYVANSTQKIPTLNVFPELNDVNGLPKQDRATFDAFTSKLNSLNIPNKFIQVAGADHDFSKFGNTEIVLTETMAYFKANLK
jgi:acetyl esterase/lipase